MEKLEIFVKDNSSEISINNYKSLLEDFDSIKIYYQIGEEITKTEARERIIRYVNEEHYNKLETLPEGSYSKFRKNVEKAQLNFL